MEEEKQNCLYPVFKQCSSYNAAIKKRQGQARKLSLPLAHFVLN